MLETILNKLSLKELGKHLSNYCNLYVKPIETWKKAIDLRNSSYDFIVLNLVYFTILILLVVKDLYLAIPICIVEIILTLFPFLIFIGPYKISSFLFKIQWKWNRLFRLLIIIKLQILPLFYLLFKFANYSESENIYLLTDNFILLVWIGFIVIFPLISNLKYFQKIIWIFLNYIFFIGLILIGVAFFSEINFMGKFGDEIMLLSPAREYSDNNTKLTNSMLFIDDSSYMLIGTENKPNVISYQATQFVDLRLYLLFNNKVRNNLIRDRIRLDSIMCINDKTKISIKDSLQSLYDKKEINIKVLDSFREILHDNFQKDLILTDSLSKFSKFKSNRKYYNKLNLYLDDYCRSYFNQNEINEIYKNAKEKTILKLERGLYITLLKIDNSIYDNTKKPYIELRKELEERENKANWVASVFFYPIDKILEACGYYS